MRASHPLSPRTTSMLRRLTALPQTATLTPSSPWVRSIGKSNDDLVISSSPHRGSRCVQTQDSSSHIDNGPSSTVSGTVTMSTSYVKPRGIGSTTKELTTIVVSRERSTDKFQWAPKTQSPTKREPSTQTTPKSAMNNAAKEPPVVGERRRQS